VLFSRLNYQEGFRSSVLVNNAGIGITGPIGGTPHSEYIKAVRHQNFNASLTHVAKSGFTAYLRAQKSGLLLYYTIAGYIGVAV